MNQQERKFQFTQDWLDLNWDKFKKGQLEDVNGSIIKVSDAITNMVMDEIVSLDKAFLMGAVDTYEMIEKIAKAYLIEMVVADFWYNHLAAEEEAGHELEWAKP